MRALERFRLADKVIETWERHFEDFTPVERMGFLLKMAELGLRASPKTIETLDDRMQFSLIISGINPKQVERTVLVDQGRQERLALPEAGPDMEEV
jgi:hypothetical protein